MTEEKILTGYASMDKPWMKYYNESEKNYTIPKCKIVENLYRYIDKYSQEIALEFMSIKVTYAQLKYRIEHVAKALKALGVEEGDTISVCLPNTPEAVYLFYAINKVGAVANMLDPRNSNVEFLRLLNEANTTYLFAMDTAIENFSDVIKEAKLQGIIAISVIESLPLLIRKIVVRKNPLLKAELASLSNENVLRWSSFYKLGKGKDGVITCDYVQDAPACICYTGGSTGVPKGAVMSDYNFNAYIVGLMALKFKAFPGECGMVAAPPWTMYGISNSINAYLCLGLKLILIPKADSQSLQQMIVKYSANHIVAVPTMLRAWMSSKGTQNVDLSYIKTLILGAEKLDATFETEANQWLLKHNCRTIISKGYGMTELGAAVCYTKDSSNIAGTVGIPYVTDVVTVFNEIDGDYVEGKIDEQGEVCVQSPKCMLGYLGTGEVQTSTVIKMHADGTTWVHTGDIGHVDKNGCLYIDGRIKRMIIRDGYKVFPSAIETVISKHMNINQCAVVGVKDLKLGYVAKVYLILKDKTKQDETIEQIKRLCQKELYSYEIPDYFEVMDAFPITNVGKIDYAKLEKSN